MMTSQLFHTAGWSARLLDKRMARALHFLHSFVRFAVWVSEVSSAPSKETNIFDVTLSERCTLPRKDGFGRDWFVNFALWRYQDRRTFHLLCFFVQWASILGYTGRAARKIASTLVASISFEVTLFPFSQLFSIPLFSGVLPLSPLMLPLMSFTYFPYLNVILSLSSPFLAHLALSFSLTPFLSLSH